MEILYRPAEPSDAQALLDYLKTIGAESHNLTFGPEGLPFSAQQEAQFLEEQLRNPLSQILIALDHGEIVGNSSIDGCGRARMRHRFSFAVSVRKSHWGQGIGTELLRRQIAFARAAGAEVISLEVLADNERARRLYEKFGFRKFGTFEKFFKINGKYYDADYMNLYL